MKAALSVSRAARPAGEITALVVPAAPPQARKSWRRLVNGINATEPPGARQIIGTWLRPGCAYSLPVGAVVVICDQYRGRWHVTMSTVDVGALTAVKEWELKSPMGKRVTDYIGRRLPNGSAFQQAVLLDERSNRWDARCSLCRNPVPAQAGRLITVGDDRTRVAHLRGQCLPPPPPPAVVAPNRRSEPCYLCGHWVQAGSGVAVRLATRDTVTRSWYRAAHQTEPGGCPADALPGPVNQVEGWCTDCGELVRPGEGYWSPAAEHSLHHSGACPPPALAGPSWVIRRPRHEPVFEVGQVRRVRVDLRRGGDPIPLDAPGRRVLGEQYIEMVALVVEVVARRTRQWARVCPATGPEALELVAADTTAAVEARPDGGAYSAGWSAERIGDVSPWLAEITDRDPDFVYRREFLRPHRDYRQSNSRGTRGVFFHWVLLPGRVYEAKDPLSRRDHVRRFLRATAEGDVAEITREEVEAWLNHAPTWAAS